ncbi:hypothetical protein FG386_002070 [Cryptosporidium ryanae]|uniref:uncharacterized protein n=1 Tax=Cryptosporidium ryanae TaxID=515981 RepID=UPI00351A575F|nr:hypothetical protein FG386_002070 [Cryptosporidium ryanae]
MKVETPQIIWHSKDSKFADRVYSLDFQPGTSRLATAGADEFIHIWEITRETEWKLKILSRLFGHEKEVNCVRFSSTGELLASGGQDDSLCIWKPTNEKQQVVFGQNSEDVLGFPEYWKRITIMRCMAPVVSLSWSPDDSKVVVGTEDDRVTIWNVHTGKLLRQLDGHSHMVMGVSWDPKDQFIASQSSDQTVRLWKSKTAKTKKKTGLILKSNQKKEVGEELTSGLVDEEKTAEEVGKAREETGKETTDNVADQAAEIVQKDTIDTVTDLTIVSNCSVTDNDVNMEVDDKQNHGLSKNENKNLKSDIKSWKLHHTIKYEALESNLRNKQQTRFEVENLENQELVIGDCATPNNIKLSNSNSSSNGGQKRRCLFLAESATTTFFRRLDWSPNGEILVVPTGQYFINTQSGEHRKSASMDGNSKDLGGSNQVLMPVSYVFLREEYSYPAAVLPSPDGTTSSIRFNQVAFLPLSNEIENNKENPSLNQQNSFSSYRTTPKDNQESWIFLNKSKTNEIMPRYIFSVITLAGTIYIYDTQHIHPIVAIRGLHFQGMNDASWSSDGHTLAVASSDGYITIVFFENGELGQVLKTPVVPKSSTTETPHQSKDHCECKDTDVPDTLSLPISNLNPVDIRRGTGGEKEEEIYRGVENDNSNKIQTINLECNKSNQDEDSNTKYNDNAAPKIKRRINPTVLISYE